VGFVVPAERVAEFDPGLVVAGVADLVEELVVSTMVIIAGGLR
jgi:hypothetical protein